ncbi:hypothetical protein SLA2020_409590 [Shorea laevis]
MCKGLQEGKIGGVCRLPCPQDDVSPDAAVGLVHCELCGSRASLYCQADDAFLCRKCDKRVHGANFLALRHIRCFLCNTCQNLTQRYLIGASVEVVLPTMVSRTERSQCNPTIEKQCPRNLKRPFLLL